MANRVAEAVAVTAFALVLTACIALPVLRAPSERVFGMEIVGRHHDPFTVMEQFRRPIVFGPYMQPLTDVPGALMARVVGAVAAYNWIVLVTFPLSAAAAYALARYLRLSAAAAAVAAIAFAFSPFHIAQSAYHPHIAQTQWIPLYLLALWRCLDRPSPAAVVLLGLAAAAVTLSNFYGGLIAAVITGPSIAAYYGFAARRHVGAPRRLAITLMALATVAAGGGLYVWSATHGAGFNGVTFAFARADLFRYSAKWWGYLVPPVANPLLGGVATRVWSAAGVREGLLEQQVSLGLGIVVLSLVAVVAWLVRDRHAALVSATPILAVVGGVALVCSLSPERTIAGLTISRPSALLYSVAPMFRAYGRFGVVVQLMAVLLAGVGCEHLWRVGTTPARGACLALLLLTAVEY